MKRFHRAPLGAVAALALLPLTAPAQLTPERKQLNIDSFEYVWQTVRDKHWQTRPGGLDWQSVHDELRPAIEKADSMDTARGVMRDMLARLHQTHFGIIPGDFYEDWENRGARGQNGTGIDLRLVGSEVLVTSLEPGSSAAAQGIQPGWRILKIGSTDLAPLVAKLEEANRGSSLRDLLARRDLLGLLGGQTGDSIEVDFLDGSGRRVTKKLAEQTPEGTLITFGYLYPSYVWFHAARLGEGRVGYVGFNLFLDAERVMTDFGKAVQGCADCQGFIVDLRGNPGGLGAMAMGMAGWFLDRPGQRLGTLYLRGSTLNFVVNPRAATFEGPLAILVDGASASTSEIFAAGLKDLHRARVFGTRTAAAALPSLFEKLPNGDGFQYAIANYISEGGRPLEGLGVTPDVEAPVTRQALLDGKDPALDAALAWIRSLPARSAAKP